MIRHIAIGIVRDMSALQRALCCLAMALTYGRYLALDELLHAQHPLSAGPEHDELLFIRGWGVAGRTCSPALSTSLRGR
jgi:hypothetical protein